jgi:hypothetical protein
MGSSMSVLVLFVLDSACKNLQILGRGCPVMDSEWDGAGLVSSALE